MIANKADALVVVEEQAQTIKALRDEVQRLRVENENLRRQVEQLAEALELATE